MIKLVMLEPLKGQLRFSLYSNNISCSIDSARGAWSPRSSQWGLSPLSRRESIFPNKGIEEYAFVVLFIAKNL